MPKDKNPNLNKPYDELSDAERCQERQEWENGAPARDDQGNPVDNG